MFARNSDSVSRLRCCDPPDPSPSPSLRDLTLRLAALNSLLYARMHSVCPSRQHRLPSLLLSPFSSPSLPLSLFLPFSLPFSLSPPSPSFSPSLSPCLSLSPLLTSCCCHPPAPFEGGGGWGGVRKFNLSSVPTTPTSPPPSSPLQGRKFVHK